MIDHSFPSTHRIVREADCIRWMIEHGAGEQLMCYHSLGEDGKCTGCAAPWPCEWNRLAEKAIQEQRDSG